METVSDDLHRASQALKAGGAGMPGRIAGTDPEGYGFAGRMVYRTSYGVSYAVVYPIALMTRLIPRENAVVHGLTDGAMAARAAVFGRGKGSSKTSHAGETPGMMPQPA